MRTFNDDVGHMQPAGRVVETPILKHEFKVQLLII